jgi:tetratricopeptide (TPR) repeat protein
MRHLRLAAALAFLLPLIINAEAGEAACTADAFERDPRATFEACSALLATNPAAPAKAEALKIRGRAAFRLGRVDAAIADYDAALALAPNDAELHVRRGWVHYDKQENDAAIARAAHALKLDPKRADAYDLAGSVMTRAGDYARARAAYDDALRLDPRDPMIRFHRYELFDGTGRLPEALAELDALLKLPVAEITRGPSFSFHGRRVTFRTGAKLYRAITLKAMGRSAETAAIYDQLVAEEPGAVTYASRAAHHRHAETASEEAIQADIDKAIALDPDYWAPRDVRGRLYFYAQRYDAAAQEFARAIALAPEQGGLRWWRSMALRKLDRVEEATNDALSVLDVDPYYVVNRKMRTLIEHGYFVPPQEGADPMPALRDAVRACMLDERCW